jgi:UDP-GlcNAc:undecaprenyl-phosphate GlcNAc-1-phosphate transferase
MKFPESFYAGGFFVAAVLTALAMPLCIRLSRKLGLVDEPGERKLHGQAVSLAGGIAVFCGALIALALGAFLLSTNFLDGPTHDRLQYGLAHRAGRLAVICSGGLAMLCLGLLDDRYELSPGIKFFGQLVVAFLVAASGIRITLFVPSIVFSYAATVLWILTLVNAFNFMDNMNGLCAGVTAITASFFGIAAAIRGDYLVAGLAFVFAGAFCGFLPFNFPEAKAFLGDSGSHLAGFIVAVLGILPHYYSTKHPHTLAVFMPLLILAVPLYDLISVVIIRMGSGEPVYVGDNNHLSHRLLRRGYSRRTAVLLIWLATVVTGILGLLL